MHKKSYGKESHLAYLGHALIHPRTKTCAWEPGIENRNGLIAAAMATEADGYAEREAALLLLEAKQKGKKWRIAVGADKAYDTRDFVAAARALNVTAHGARTRTDAASKSSSTRWPNAASSCWRALVLCVDEKSRIQALDRAASIAHEATQIERRTHDNGRHGTPRLFAALDTRTGKIIAHNQQHHRSEEFRNFLGTIERNVPEELDIHLIMQLRNPQDQADSELAGQASPLPGPRHAHLSLMAEPGRTLVRHADRTPGSPRRTPLDPRN